MTLRRCLIHKDVNGKNGFTLIEVLAVVMIIGVLASIAMVSVVGFMNRSEAAACQVNRELLEREYFRYLLVEELEHSDELFVVHRDGYGEICLNGGEIYFFEGEVLCSLHGEVEEEEEEDESEDGSGVPFL